MKPYVKAQWLLAYSGLVDSRGRNCRFFIPPVVTAKAAYRVSGKSLATEEGRSRDSSTRIKRLPMVARLLTAKREGRCPSDVEHRQIKPEQRIECDHGKLKRIIGSRWDLNYEDYFYARFIKGIEVMRNMQRWPSILLW
jgi:IS6 family transposase